MAFAGMAGANARELQRHNFAVEQRNQPAHRTHEALRRLAAPVHALGPVNAGDFFGQRLGKDLGRRTTFLLHRRTEVFAFRGRDLFQRIDGDVELARKCRGCRSRCSIFVGNLQRRPGDLLGDVGLRGRDCGRENGQAARRGVGLQRGGFDKSLALQEVTHAASQFVARAIDHARGNFFGTDLEKKVRHKKQLAISN